jgi:hypothetical protein
VIEPRAALVLASWLCVPCVARAYSDPNMFDGDVLEGGGGGHYYSGSPAEGYACDTCHTGGARPALHVSGVPSRYVPGATYELTLTWTAPGHDVAGLMELTDARGRGAGALALASEHDVHEEEYCEPRSQMIRAAELLAAAGGRTIAALPDCGATQLRVQWTAPQTRAGAVWLAGSVVASDHNGDLRGDGVTSFSQPIPAFGGSAPEQTLHGHCTATLAPLHARDAPWWSAAMLAALCARFIARRRRRALLLTLLGACQTDSTGVNRVDITHGSAVRAWDGGHSTSPPDDAAVGGEAASAADAAMPTAAWMFRVTTVSQNGSFAPKNVGAIWVEDGGGAWVKTLAVWAGVSTRYLTQYCAANKTGNKVDAITSATLAEHETHAVAWDLSDADHEVVPDGDYQVLVEVTDHNGPGQLLTIPFTKSPAPVLTTPADTAYFHDVELRIRGD